jgi:hypothetical protein
MNLDRKELTTGHSIRKVRDFLKNNFKYVRVSAEISRRRAIASAVCRPCLNAFRLPFAAPRGDRPAFGTYCLASPATGTAPRSASLGPGAWG